MAVLVIDIGSSSVRALLYDDEARLIPDATVIEAQEILTEPQGAATLDMLAVQARVERCVDRILLHPAAAQIRIVGTDTLVGNLLAVDRAGLPLTPVYTYADTRSAESVKALRARVDAEKKHQDTGCLLHTAYHPARLDWLRQTQPQQFREVAQWTDIGTYLLRQWLGAAPTSYSAASWSGLFNRETLDWDVEWLDILGVRRDQLPDLADYDAFQTGLLPAFAERWSALRDVPFCLVVGDGVAANVGAGCVRRTDLALTVGTTAALRTMSDEALPPVPAGLWSYRAKRNLHLIGGATSEGGNVYRWAMETLALPDARAVEQALAGRAPDAHGLTVLPLLAGERSPGWLPDATGSIVGLRLSTTPLDILQAALEGVAHRLALVAEQVYALTGDSPRIVASGGALRASPVWGQMIANALNQPLHMTTENELTARGTAILALHALRGAALSDFAPTLSRNIQPQAEVVAILRRARDRQVALYNKLRGS